MAQTCALIAPVQPVLHRVSCSNKTLTNAPKHYETHQYLSLGSNGVDRVCSLRKNTIRFRTTNFCIYVQPVLYQVLCSNETNPKCTQTVRNTPILQFRFQWGGSGVFVAKNSNATSWHKLLHRVPCSNETLPNAPKHYEMFQNMSLVPMGWIGCVR